MTVQSRVFACTIEQATFVAECANLKHYVTERSGYMDGTYRVERGHYELWQDYQTYGGGARICWKGGIAWVSRHSGYAWADIVDEVCDIFREIGCKEAVDRYVNWAANPAMYSVEAFREYSAEIRFV